MFQFIKYFKSKHFYGFVYTIHESYKGAFKFYFELLLPIRNQKDIIKRIIKDNNINILGIQETELPINVPETLLTIPNYNIVIENNSLRSRAAIYINDNITYLSLSLKMIVDTKQEKNYKLTAKRFKFKFKI